MLYHVTSLRFIYTHNLEAGRRLVMPLCLLLVLWFSGLGLTGAASESIRAGVPAYFPPQYLVNEKTGQPYGFAIEVMDEIATRADLSVTYQVYPSWDATLTAFQAGEVDLIPNLGVIPKRQQFALFTHSVETQEICAFVRSTNHDIRLVNDLRDRRISVVKRNYGVDLMTSYPDALLDIHDSLSDAMMDLLSGHCDAFVYPAQNALYIIHETGLKDRITMLDDPLAEVKRAIAVHRDRVALYERIEPVVAAFVQDPRYREVYAKWHGDPKPSINVTRIILIMSTILLGSVFGLILWHTRRVKRLNQRLLYEIGERQETERILRDREELLSRLVSSIDNFVFTIDREGRFTGLYGNWVERKLLSPDELIDKTFDDYFSPTLAELHRTMHQQALNGESVVYDWSIEINQEMRYFHTILSPLQNANKQIIGAVGVNRDISPEKKKAEQLRQRTELLQNIMDNVTSIIFVKDLEGSYITVNERFKELFHLPENGSIERLPTRHFDAETLQRIEETDRLVLETGKPQQLEQFVYVDDEEFVFLVTKVPLYNEAGQPYAICGVATDITEIQRTQEKLRDSEDKFRQLSENISEVFWIRDHETIFYISPAYEMVWGRSCQSMYENPNSFVESIHPEDQELVQAAFRSARYQEKGEFDQEFRIVRPDGTFRWIWMRTFPISGDYSTPRWVGIADDITDRKIFEIALKDSEARLHNILNSIPDRIVQIDRQMRILWANDAALKANPHAIDSRCYHAFPDRTDICPGCPSHKALHSGKIESNIIHSLANKNGQYAYFECIGIPIPGADGRIVGAIEISRDVTDRKLAEIALRESEARIMAQYQSIPIPAFTWEYVAGAFYLREFNRQANITSKGRVADFVGLAADEIYADRPDIVENMKQAYFDKKDVSVETPYRSRSFQVDLHMIITFTYVPPNMVLMLTEDITPIKSANEKLKASLDEKEVLLREIHHRVKNNLQIISSLIDFQTDAVKDEKALTAFRDSQNRVQSMARIHEHFYQSQDLASINMAEYIEDLATHLLQVYGAFHVHPIFDFKDVILDIDMAIPCGLIVNELISNSMKYAFPTGKPGELHLVMKPRDDTIFLQIWDNGVGLPPNLDLENPSTLGLQLVTILTQQLSGTLEIRSDAGTSFTIVFPSERT